jgi:lysophospholipase L1-like esterase
MYRSMKTMTNVSKLSAKSKSLVLGFPALLFALSGCSGTMASFTSPSSLNTSSQGVSPEAKIKAPPLIDAKVYHAYGASITAGYLLSDPSTQAYPALVAKAEQVALSNYAIPGAMACDIAPREIFAHSDSPTLATHPAYTLHVGTNDVDHKGSGAYEATYIRCHQAAIAWLAVPLEYKILATGKGVTTAGAGRLDTANNWTVWTTAGQGASVSFTVNLTAKGAIYAWPLLDDNNTTTYTVSLDGVVIASQSVEPNPQMATTFNTTRSLGFIRISGVNAGSHVVKFTQASSGTDGVSILGVATPGGPSSDTLPTVLVANITGQLHGNFGYACDLSNSPCQKYDKDIQSDVDLFAGDGLNVRLYDTNEYFNATSAEMSDPIHPNALGHQEIARALEEVW